MTNDKEGSETKHATRSESTMNYFDERIGKPNFGKGIIFLNKEQFVKVVKENAFQHKKQVKFVKNDRKRCMEVCTSDYECK